MQYRPLQLHYLRLQYARLNHATQEKRKINLGICICCCANPISLRASYCVWKFTAIHRGRCSIFLLHRLSAAANWYENKLGLKRVTNEDWVVIFELTPSSFLGLVNATGGSLRPTENKAALLSIETAELEAWYEKLKGVEGINMIHGIKDGADGMIQEFRMTDPGGYIIEFFRWHSSREESKRYLK